MAVTVPLWEWVAARDVHGGSAGVSSTRHGAMQALSRALVQAGRPRTGQVVPVTLPPPIRDLRHYRRGAPAATAIYDGQVIQWH